MFKNLMSGGACGAGEEMESSNPFTSMIDAMLMQPSQTQQSIPIPIEGIPIPLNEMEMKKAQHQELLRSEFESISLNSQKAPEQAILNEIQFKEMKQFEEIQREQQIRAMLETEETKWNLMAKAHQEDEHKARLHTHANAQSQHQEPIIHQLNQFRTPQPQHSGIFQNRELSDYNLIQNSNDSWLKELENLDSKTEESKAEEIEKTKEEIESTSGNIIELLENSSNPKHKKSKLLKFMKKLNTGQYKIQGNSLIKNKSQINTHAHSRINTQTQLDTNTDNKEGLVELTAEAALESVWKKYAMRDEEEILNQGQEDDSQQNEIDEELEKAFDEIEQDPQLQDEFNNILRDNWEDDGIQDGEEARKYEFAKDNEYLQCENLLELAKQLMKEGKINEAISALEAEVQQNADSSEGWRLLGQLHSENDEDGPAIAALTKGLEADAYNLDALLALGVSQTNELERKEAISNLLNYIKFHPQYCELRIPQIEAESIVEAIHSVISLFRKALQMNPRDEDILRSIGVLHFSLREFEVAEECFRECLKLNPHSHALWNKLAATYANRMNLDKALQGYKIALSLYPQYTRAQVNIALALDNHNHYQRAAENYVIALGMNPKAVHIWEYLRDASMNMLRDNYVDKCYEMNLPFFQNEFKIKPNHHTLQEINLDNNIRILSNEEGENTLVPLDEQIILNSK